MSEQTVKTISEETLVVTSQSFNAPWGMAMSSCDFGPFSNVLLVGNFGDGAINVVDAKRGDVIGSLLDANGVGISVDGLWGITFGDEVDNAKHGSLYFAAGANDEMDGLFGYAAASK